MSGGSAFDRERRLLVCRGATSRRSFSHAKEVPMKPFTLSKQASLRLAGAMVCLCTGFAQAQTTKADMGTMHAKPSASAAQSPMPPGHGSEQMNKMMMSGMDSMRQMKMSGDADKDFAMMMKMHHQQALDMAKVEVEHGKSPEMKAMAKRIIAAQKKEIAEFDKWMKKHP
jgi:uncharacterized protein (DUF305 family)